MMTSGCFAFGVVSEVLKMEIADGSQSVRSSFMYVPRGGKRRARVIQRCNTDPIHCHLSSFPSPTLSGPGSSKTPQEGMMMSIEGNTHVEISVECN
jgi:hypothetical protein